MPISNVAIVKVTLRQTGNTPALVNKTFWVQRSQTVRWVVEFIKQQLKCQPHESLVSMVYHVVLFISWNIDYSLFMYNKPLHLHWTKTLIRYMRYESLSALYLYMCDYSVTELMTS